MVTQEELEKMSPEEIAQLQKQNCIFCKIVAGEVPGAKIFEDNEVVSILDINPANKGHAIVLPKEHYPILPLVPPPVFKQMFLDAKLISTSIKKSTLAGSISLFIANGALAGQQAPHFLFHLIPDHRFTFSPKPELKEKNDSLADALKNNLGIMMQNHMRREGDVPVESQPDRPPQQVQTAQSIPEPSPQELALRRDQIAKIIEENPDVRELLKTDVQAFKKTIEANEQLKELFAGVDLESLSRNLQQLQQPESKPVEETIVPENPSPSAVSQYASSSQPQKPEVFLGADPFAQKEKVFAYFDEKPKAKELLISDVEKFKSLLATREDIQLIFADVNIDKLSQKLNESLRGDSHN